MSKIVSILLLVVVMICITFQVYQYIHQPVYAYINVHEVFENFEMKKELEKKFDEVKDTRQKLLDSLMTGLQIINKRIERDKGKNKDDMDVFSVKREEYLKKKEEFEGDNQALTDKYNQQIIAQLKQYVKNYGSENNYSIVFGDDNNGVVMYSVEANDITKPVTKYINGKYNGK